MGFTAVGSTFQTTSTSASFTPSTVGDLVLLEVLTLSQVTSISLSSGNCTWTQIAYANGVNNPYSAAVFAGRVTSASLGTLAIGFTGGSPTIRVTAQEFNASGQWILDTKGTLDNSGGTNLFPSLTPAGAGELYFGYAVDKGTASAGSTSGYTYFVDAHGNGMCYNPSCTSGAQQPQWGDSGSQFGISILMRIAPPSANGSLIGSYI